MNNLDFTDAGYQAAAIANKETPKETPKMSTPNLKILKDPFPETSIEWRIGQSGYGKKGFWAKCLAYIDARAARERLDEACGPGGWSVEYRPVGEGGFIARIGIKIDGEWVYREDGADRTDIEAFKGGISSAFKRTAAAWGIGSYLYDLESGWAECIAEDKPGYEYAKTKDGKEFYWKPPQLPSWAVPKGKEQAAPAAPTAAAYMPTPKPGPGPVVAPKPSGEPRPGVIPGGATTRPRDQVVTDIIAAAKAIRLSQNDMAQWIHEMFKKDMKALSVPEMEKFLETLQMEAGRQGIGA